VKKLVALKRIREKPSLVARADKKGKSVLTFFLITPSMGWDVTAEVVIRKGVPF
jgi:hypothetical protein